MDRQNGPFEKISQPRSFDVIELCIKCKNNIHLPAKVECKLLKKDRDGSTS